MTADELLDEMVNAYTDAYDIDATPEHMMKTALRVLYDWVEFRPPHILGSLVFRMSRTDKEVARHAQLFPPKEKAPPRELFQTCADRMRQTARENK